MAILKANYLPQERSGRIGRSVAYYTWREGADQQPRDWRDQDGRLLGYDQAKHEVAEHASEHSYTYRVVLSTRDAQLEPEHYASVLSDHFDQFLRDRASRRLTPTCTRDCLQGSASRCGRARRDA